MARSPISYSEWLISEHQLAAQVKLIERQIDLEKERLLTHNSEDVWKTIDGLKAILKGLKKAQRELTAAKPPQPKHILGWIEHQKFKIYLWAAGDRLSAN